MPVELWLLVFSQLGKKDLLSLANTSKHIGAIAEVCLYRSVKLRSPAAVQGTISLSAGHRRAAVRSLTISLGCLTGTAAHCAGVVFRLAGALSQLPNLAELAITESRVPAAAVRDILADCPSTQLKKFNCDSDALVLASWTSLTRQKNLEEFRGLLHHVHAPPPHISPRAFPELRVLSAGAPFVDRIYEGCKVTHLSMYVPRASARNILARITGVLGEQLVALRVVRSFLVPAGGSAFWESDSPVVLCGALKAPALRVFELKDRAQAPASSRPGWNATYDILRGQPGYGPAFSAAQCSTRTPALSTLIWRPLWERSARLLKSVVREHVMDAMALLPVTRVVMPLVEDIDEQAGTDEMEGWTVWEWSEGGEGAAIPPEWWQGDGTVEETHLYAPVGEAWVTF